MRYLNPLYAWDISNSFAIQAFIGTVPKNKTKSIVNFHIAFSTCCLACSGIHSRGSSWDIGDVNADSLSLSVTSTDVILFLVKAYSALMSSYLICVGY